MTVAGRLYLTIALFVLAVVAGIAWQVFNPSQPSYRGRPLAYWLRQHVESADPAHPDPVAHEAAASAIRHIGTNALPTLLAWAAMTNTASHQRIMTFLGEKASERLGLLSANDYHALASYGFRQLKTAGKPSVPGLVNLLTNADPDVRSGAAWCLCFLGPAAEEAVPALLRSLSDPGAQNNGLAALQAIGTKPDVLVPVLIGYLSSTNLGQQGWATARLADYGTNARAAVPKLLEFLESPQWYLRGAATNFLPQIDAEAATRAGLR